eukprot:475420_1
MSHLSLTVLLSICVIFNVFNAQPTTYYTIEYPNVNNIFSAADAKQSNQYVQYLGQFDTTTDCMNACITKSTKNNLCMSYTYQTSSIKDEYEKTCYARFGYPYGVYWNPYPGQTGINSGQIIWKCSSNIDCSLNGQCGSNGNCTCNKGWKGGRCNELNLGKATKGNGYNYLNAKDNYYSSWGGSVKKVGNSYYMVASEFVNHCGIYSWVMNSQVILAKASNGWNSAYERQSVISLPDAHEPDIAIGPNGEFVVYHSFYNRSKEGYKSPCTGCNQGATGNKCDGPSSPMFYTQMVYTNDITAMEIQWSEPVNILKNGQATNCDSNFASVILKNGSVVGLMREPASASIIHLVTAKNWKESNSYEIASNPLFPQLIQWYAEDPCIWIDCDGNYHALFHNMQTDGQAHNEIAETVIGAHAFSVDGVNWIWGGVAYDANVEFTDGTKITFPSLERPHVILDSDGCSVVALTNGAFTGDKDKVYTLLQPVQ